MTWRIAIEAILQRPARGHAESYSDVILRTAKEEAA
jgi:hypothetical protein